METVVAPGAPALPINRWTRPGWFATIAFLAGVGLVLCSIANAASRATEAPSPLIYWAGILFIAVPTFYRLTSQDASARERLALACLLGLALYGVKLVRDAPIFSFSDEVIHAYGSNQISQHHHLFNPNPILAISRYYPGLEGATAALRSLTGLSSFGAGAIVIGAARLTMTSAMFVLFWRVSRSPRIAGIGTAIFTGNFNYLFWSAQFSYESLALPLLMMVLLTVVEIELGPRAARTALRVLAAIGIAAIVVTHHVTSYATVAILSLLSVASAVVNRGRREVPNPWPLALLALVLTVLWLFVVASATVGYLTPVLSDALKSTLHTAAGEAPARQLFQGETSTVGPTPLLARAVALLAILLLAAGLPFGLYTFWRRFREQPVAWIFALAAIGFFGALALRLAPEAWETGNRASEFLFIGLAFILGGVGLEKWRPRVLPWLGRALMASAMAVVVVGGAITGWPWDSQLALPVRAHTADGGTIYSPPMAMARWAKQWVPGGVYGALSADARMLLVPGNKVAFSDYSAQITEIIPAPELATWAVPLLREHGIRYVVADQRVIANDGTRGYYFSLRDSPRNALLPRSAVTKFEGARGVSRIYDNGSIVIFDLDGNPTDAPPIEGTVTEP
jgi:hypothetical protein